MPFVRVADFEADDASIDRFVEMLKADPTPPEGVPATGINVLANREKGKLRAVVFFATEADLQQGSAALDAMNPGDDSGMRRTNVETFELLVQLQE